MVGDSCYGCSAMSLWLSSCGNVRQRRTKISAIASLNSAAADARLGLDREFLPAPAAAAAAPFGLDRKFGSDSAATAAPFGLDRVFMVGEKGRS